MPDVPLDIADAWEALEAGYDALRPARERREKYLRAWAGQAWADGQHERFGDAHNIIDLAASSVVPLLRGDVDEIEVLPQIEEMGGVALAHQTVLRHDWRQLRVDETLEAALMEALIAPFGLVRVGVRDALNQATTGVAAGPGQRLLVERVAFTDYAIDPDATYRSEARWEAMRVRVNRDYAVRAKVYGQHPPAPGTAETPGTPGTPGAPANVMTPDEAADAIALLPTMDDKRDTRQRQYGLARRNKRSSDPFALVELWYVLVYDGERTWEVVLPSLDHSRPGKYLAARVLSGVLRRPLHALYVSQLPGQLLPQPVCARVWDQHNAAHAVTEKTIRDAAQSKKVNVTDAKSATTAIKIAEAEHNDTISGDPDGIRAVEHPPMTAELLPAIGLINDLYQTTIGAVHTLVGRSGGTEESATKTSILNTNALRVMARMRKPSEETRLDIARQMLYLNITDPQLSRRVPYSVPGYGQATLVYAADRLEGRLDDFLLRVNFRPEQTLDPITRSQMRIKFFEVLPSLVPLGVTEYGIRKIGEDFGIPDADAMISLGPLEAQTRAEASAMLGTPAPDFSAVVGTPAPGPSPKPTKPGSTTPRRPTPGGAPVPMAAGGAP